MTIKSSFWNNNHLAFTLDTDITEHICIRKKSFVTIEHALKYYKIAIVSEQYFVFLGNFNNHGTESHVVINNRNDNRKNAYIYNNYLLNYIILIDISLLY